jgi:putative heme degradation protein
MASLEELRAEFLTDAQPIMKHVLAIAAGTPSDLLLGKVDKEAIAQVWKVLEPMLQQAGDIKKLEIKNSGEVLKLVAGGKLTFKEAKELMQLFQAHTEMEELPKLLEALDKAE